MQKLPGNDLCILHYPWLLIILIFFLSCNLFEYEPYSTELTNVPPPQPNNISIDISGSLDTLNAWDYVTINYSIQNDSIQDVNVSLYVDTQLVAQTSNPTYIGFNTESFSDGLYQIRMEFLIPTGSGSLADKLGAEYYSTEKQFPIYIDNRETVYPPELEAISLVNTRPLLKWNEYEYHNFQEYKIYRKLKDANTDSLLLVIKDRNITEYTDSTYLGGNVRYKIELGAKSKILSSNYSDFAGNISTLANPAIIPDNHILLTWSRCDYDSNFDYYEIRKGIEKNEGIISYESLVKIYDIDSTNYVDKNAEFGRPLNYQLFLGNKNLLINSNVKEILLGKECPYYDFISFVPTIRAFCLYAVTNGELDTEYNSMLIYEDNYDIIKLDGFLIFFSPDGEKAYKKKNIWNSSILYQVNPLNIDAVLDTIQIVNKDGRDCGFTQFYVTNNGLIVLYDLNSSDYVFYDVLNKQHFSTIDWNSFDYIISISPNGKYLLNGDGSFYKVDYKTYTKLYTIASAERYQLCFTEDDEEYVVTSNSSISIRRSMDQTIINQFPIENDLNRPVIDSISGYLGGFTREGEKYRIYNLLNGSKIKEIPLVYDISLESFFYWSGSTLFLSAYLWGSYFVNINF